MLLFLVIISSKLYETKVGVAEAFGANGHTSFIFKRFLSRTYTYKSTPLRQSLTRC